MSGLIHQPIAHRKSHQFVDTVQVQLLHDAAAVGVHRIDTEVEDDGNLFVGLAFGQHLQDFALAAAQQIDGVGDVLAVVVEDGVGDGRAQIAFSGSDRPDSGNQVGGARGLEEITAGARTRACGLAAVSRRVASRPLSSGMATSMTTTAGRSSAARSTASRALPASPTISMSGWALRIILKPWRTTA